VATAIPPAPPHLGRSAVAAEEQHVAARRTRQTEQQADGAGFSGAIWPEHVGDAARLQPEREVGERDNFAIFLGNSSQLGNHGCTFLG